MYRNRPRPIDEWRAPKGSKLAAVTTAIMTVVLLVGGIIAVWLLFGRDISKFYDSVFIIPDAQKRASDHILGKYGFDPDIISTDIPDSAEHIFMPSDKSDFAFVVMESEGVRFTCAVNYKDSEAPVGDTYQTEDIRAAVSAALDECEPWKVRLELSQKGSPDGKQLFYNAYFTGADWNLLSAERPLEIYVRYFDVPLYAERFAPLLKLEADIDIETYTEDENGRDILVSSVKISDGQIS